MVIYLRHPVHGTKVACDEKEAEVDETLGWVRFTYNQEEPSLKTSRNSKEKKSSSASNSLNRMLGLSE